MRTNIDIDETLIAEVLAATGLRTKREAVDQGLRTLLLLKQQESMRRFRGALCQGQQKSAMGSIFYPTPKKEASS